MYNSKKNYKQEPFNKKIDANLLETESEYLFNFSDIFIKVWIS